MVNLDFYSGLENIKFSFIQVYIFLWFWFIILAVITALNLVVRIVQLSCPNVRDRWEI